VRFFKCVGLLMLAACGDDAAEAPVDARADSSPGDSSDPGEDAAIDASAVDPITIPFAAKVDGAPFVCGQSYPNIGSTNASYVGIDFRFFVHDVRVITASGEVPVTLDVNSFQTASGIALMDFETGGVGCQMGSVATHPSITGTVPAGTTYTGIKFVVGVPFAKNHLDATLTTAPMNVPPMYWAWSSGYKFIKVDGTSNNTGFSLHVGSTGCAASGSSPPTVPCTNPNTIPVELTGYIPGTSVIVADVAPVLADVDITTNTENTAQGCMSFPGDPECDTVMPKLGLPYGEIAAGTQQFLSLQ
jgi:uncharacterized repeat protein (TIGR04052 family)